MCPSFQNLQKKHLVKSVLFETTKPRANRKKFNVKKTIEIPT
jgi:hypothetical protein